MNGGIPMRHNGGRSTKNAKECSPQSTLKVVMQLKIKMKKFF